MKEEHLIMEETRNLIEGCLREDRHSQSSLYNLLSKKMFIVCLRYSKNKEEAEEILQEGFMKVFQFIHQYKNTGSFEGWVSKIMVNCALQRYRNKSHLHAIVNIDFVPEDNFVDDENAISKIGNKELLSMIQKLSPVYRMVFNLYVFEGFKHKEIAKLLNISEGTSKSNLSDARALLQKAVNSSLRSSQNLLQI
jgi:RNA polymerase sigma factor (sigma-70 family)